MSSIRIALYIGNELYPGGGSNPTATIAALQATALTSPILSLLNKSATDPTQLVYNDAGNPLYDTSGKYLGDSQWPAILTKLRGGGNIRETYLSFSTNGTEYMAALIASNPTAADKILAHIKQALGFDGIDLDYEGGNLSPSSPIYVVAAAATKAGLNVTAAPYFGKSDWQQWVSTVQKEGGTVAWLNLQCYAGGISNNPGDWLDMGTPIVAGSCSNCAGPQPTCSPADMQALFTLWRTGTGTVPPSCWAGTPNTAPQAIGGGFIWVYASIAGPHFDDYMNAVATGLGI